MRVLRHLQTLAGEPGPLAIALGFFDGLHLGHQSILRCARAAAHEAGGQAWALTFDAHPRGVVGAAPPPLLTSTRHKLLLLRRAGMDGCLVLPFTPGFAARPAEDFARELLRCAPGLRRLVAGHGWRFGRGGAGDTDLLARLAAEHGARVSVLDPVLDAGEPVSSTRVRAAVLAGRLGEAQRLLGRPFSVLGTVVGGRAFGRRIGYPTANLECVSEAFPPQGIYAVRAALRGEIRDGVLSYGTRPTLGGDAAPLAELHLPDFSGGLYGEEIEVFFLDHLRPQRRFADVAALREQIGRDVLRTAEILRAHGGKESLYRLVFGGYSPRPQQETRTGNQQENMGKRSAQ
jgi:riboflavin kinase/FMN adenylyltransferase